MGTDLITVTDIDRMASAIAASKLFGAATKEQAFALMLVAQAEGLHPATAARDYNIIQGRPALKADAMLARYLASGGRVEWHEHSDEKVSATFAHPAGGTLRIDWDMSRAKRAGIGAKDNWSKYPRQMLRARVISEGCRATNPGVSIGIYTPEEVEDFDDNPKRPRHGKDMGNAELIHAPIPPVDDAARQESDVLDAPVTTYITGADIEQIETALQDAGLTVEQFRVQAKIDAIGELPLARFAGAMAWITKQSAKRKTA